MSIIDLVIEVDAHLDEAGMPHAFGGALALAYIVEPRGTVDVDLNVFRAVTESSVVLAVFDEIGMRPERPRTEWNPAAGIRLRRDADSFPVDLFLSLDDESYAEIERRCVRRKFGPSEKPLPFLSAEDLTIFKLSFGRDKDWVDLRQIARAVPSLDVSYIERQLLAMRGPHMYPRLARLRRLLRGES